MAEPHEHDGTFGPDAFGRGAEHAARFFGTPQYAYAAPLILLAQTRQAERDKRAEVRGYCGRCASCAHSSTGADALLERSAPRRIAIPFSS